jgi:transcriptional regulator with XRE-family HTH domain
VPTLRHDHVRDELFDGLSEAGRRQYEGFAAVYEVRHLASRLAELRTVAQLSQREVARRSGINQADLSRIESAQITPSLPTLLRLLDAVGGTLVVARRAASRRTTVTTSSTSGTAPRKPAAAAARRRAGTGGKTTSTPSSADRGKVAAGVTTGAARIAGRLRGM